VFYRDFSQKIIPTAYFIMEKIPFPRLDTLKLDPKEAAEVKALSADMIARMHHIEGSGYGYPQNGLEANWYLGIRKMCSNLIADAAGFGKKCPLGEKLLSLIEKFRKVLEKAPCGLVNFDLWDKNLFYESREAGLRLWLIDPERSFWGDPAADLVYLDLNRMKLEEKAEAIARYNRGARFPFSAGQDLQIRYNVMLVYLGLVLYTERFSRYTFWQSGYWRNTLFSSMLAKQGFAALRNL
jgi:hypothetical protein